MRSKFFRRYLRSGLRCPTFEPYAIVSRAADIRDVRFNDNFHLPRPDDGSSTRRGYSGERVQFPYGRHTLRVQCGHSRALHGRCSTNTIPTNQKVRATPDRETRPVLPVGVLAGKAARGGHAGPPESSSQLYRWGVRSVDRDKAKSAPFGWNLGYPVSKHDFVICLAPTPQAKADSKA